MELIRLSKKYLFYILTVIFIYTLDRVSKIYIIYLTENSLNSELFTSKYLNITPIWNTGVSFGLFSFEESQLYHLLTFLIGIIIFILIIMLKSNQGLKKILLLSIIGGALGNFHDRIQFNAVFDFIDFHVGNFHWFIFNVSDIFITIGVVGMINLELFFNNKEVKQND